jgi:hypothetical protein
LQIAAGPHDFRHDFTNPFVRLVLLPFETQTDPHTTSIEGSSQIASASHSEVPTLSLDTTFKLTCAFTESPTPHHAILLFTSETQSHAVPVRIRKSKAGYGLRSEFDLAKAPSDLLALSLTAQAVSYALHVSSFDVQTPGEQFVLPFGSFKFSDGVRSTAREEQRLALEKAPSEWEVHRFERQDPAEWTFKPVEVGRGGFVGAMGSLFVLVPSVGLLAFLVSRSCL